MTPPDASLSRLFEMLDEWTDDEIDAKALYNFLFDALPACKLAAQQHAEALRGLANYLHVIRSHDPSVPRAAADFLDPKEEA